MITVPIRYRRTAKALFIQKLQHAIPSVVVLQDGIDHVSHGEGAGFWLGAAEVGVSLLVIGSVIRGIRHVRHATAHADAAEHHGVDWIDICLAGMLAVESYAEFHATGHLPRPKILLAVGMLLVGVFHPTIAAFGNRRRALRISDEGISAPSGRFSRETMTWDEVASIDMDERQATIAAMDGRSVRIDLADALQPAAIRDALLQAREQLDAHRQAQLAAQAEEA